jgi:hypothetical protein
MGSEKTRAAVSKIHKCGHLPRGNSQEVQDGTDKYDSTK